MGTIKSIKADVLIVKYKGEKITLDISKELSINENIINTQLKEAPSSYAFISMLKNKAIKKRDMLERERDTAFSKAFILYKGSDDKMNNDMAKHKANVNPKYLSLSEQYIKAASEAEVLISITKSFESRERILQTLSANIRKQQ